MNAFCGILGNSDAAAVRAMAAAMKSRGDATHFYEGPAFCVAGSSRSDPGALCLLDGQVLDEKERRVAPETLYKTCASLRAPEDLKIHGNFAAAVKVGDSWWLMRDRLGIKPLYYYEGRGFLLFSSELKGLLASGLVERHLNLTGVDLYLTFRCVPGPETIIQGVRRVSPGHVLIYANGKTSETRFAKLNVEMRPVDRRAASEQLRNLLGRALSFSDCDILWSAGIDSAALAALGGKRKAVFIALKSSWQNETHRARESAKALDIDLKVLKAQPFTESTISRIAYQLDEPVADASAVPLWLIAEQAAACGQTFLTGYGADELLGGYTRYRFLQRARGASRLVPLNFLTEITPALPPNVFVRRAGKYLTSIRDTAEAYQSLAAVFDQAERNDLYTRTMNAAIHEKGGSTAVLRPHFMHEDLTQNLLNLDLNVGLPALILPECDRVMAGHGIELQFPYLDDALVDFVISLPPKVKYAVISKPLLRQAVKGLVPPRIRLRVRRGFRVPQSGPALRVIDGFARKTITRERVEASGLFRWPFVSQILSSSTHNVYRRRQYWALLMLFAWFREFMEK